MNGSAGHTSVVKFFIAMVALSAATVIWAGENKDVGPAKQGSGGPTTEKPGATGPATAPAASQEEIKKLIAQLGDKDFKVREAATKRLIEIGKPALPALRDVVKNNASDSEAVERAKIIIRFAPDSGDIVDGLQGVIRAKDSKVKAGEDIQVEFKLQAVDKAVVVWDGKYSNGYRNHSFEVRMPDGKTAVLRPGEKRAWDKNAPHPVEITKDKPYVLPEWVEGVTFKSLKTLGLDTSKPGKYVITGRYEEVGGVEGNVKIWGGSIATNSITVEVEP
ncbi:MAG: HEAT repeat domain-containing protein [Planctomycetes bacterium]|nr:HEAT repeat domain-containing protein [Planctomycetota bacterium]